MALKKAIISVMLSALLISSTAIPIYAVEDTTNNTDTEEVLLEEEDEDEGVKDTETDNELEDIDNESESNDDVTDNNDGEKVSDNSKQQEDTDKAGEQKSGVEVEVNKDTETDNELGNIDNESESNDEITDNNESEKVSDNSKQQDDKDTEEIKEIGYTIDWGGPYIKAHYSNEPGYLDFSDVRVEVYDSNNKKVDTYKIDDTIIDNELGNQFLSRKIKVDKWGKGNYYTVKFDNLPEEIYGSKSQQIKLEYVETEIGVVLTDLSCKLKTENFNSMFYVYDLNGNSIANAEIAVDGYDSNDKKVYTKVIKSGKNGLAVLNINNSDVKYLRVNVNNVLNKSVVSGEIKSYFNQALASPSYPNVCVLSADTYYDGKIYDDEGKEVKQGCSVKFIANYKDAYDMMIFEHKDISLSLYDVNKAYNTIVLTPDENTSYFTLAEGTKYTVKTNSINDYDLKLSNNTLVVKEGESITVEATPRMTLKIINEDNGVDYSAHFKIEGYDKEFNELSHTFAVNYNQGVKVINLDSGEEYTVFIERYKETVLNIANGEKKNYGILGDNGNNDETNTSSGSKYNNDITGVPKTGDIIFSIIMILVGITGLSYILYLYYKKKGVKNNEVKK